MLPIWLAFLGTLLSDTSRYQLVYNLHKLCIYIYVRETFLYYLTALLIVILKKENKIKIYFLYLLFEAPGK